MRAADFFAGALCALAITTVSKAHADSSFRCAGRPTPAIASSAAAKSFKAPERFLPSRGKVHALVVFAEFADEVEDTVPVPAFADSLFDAEQPGSFTHYYATMSFGQLQVRGTVLPRNYRSEHPAEAYLATQPGERGAYDRFVREILRQVDADVDFSQFDSDGPDGLPDSGDDDGAVDYVFVHGRRGITADTALRLGAYFGTTAESTISI